MRDLEVIMFIVIDMTQVVSSNPSHDEVQYFVIKFISDLRQGFSGYSGFLH
jgi:hypothetical protein